MNRNELAYRIAIIRKHGRMIDKVSSLCRHREAYRLMENSDIERREKRMKYIREGMLEIRYSMPSCRCHVFLYGRYLGYLPKNRYDRMNMLDAIVRTIEIIERQKLHSDCVMPRG